MHNQFIYFPCCVSYVELFPIRQIQNIDFRDGYRKE